jgi:hypothetical protein
MKFDPNKLTRLKRPNFYAGKLLTADDLRAEQEYQREKLWQHNRLLHGYGIVVGLEVGLQENDDGSTQVIVAPGYALDGWGREIVAAEPVALYLPGDRHDLTVFVKYVEQTDDAEAKPSASAQHNASVVESAQVTFEPSSSERALAPAQRADFAIPIARLRRPHQHWQRDRNFRPARAR